MFKDAIARMMQKEIEDEATRNHFFNQSHTLSYTNILESRKAIDATVASAISSIQRLHINQTFDHLLVISRQTVNDGSVTIELDLSTNPTVATTGVLAKLSENGRHFEITKDSKEIACIVPRYMVYLIGDEALNQIRVAWQEKLRGE